MDLLALLSNPSIMLILIFFTFLVINAICLILYNKLSDILIEKRSFTEFFFVGLFAIEQVIFLIAYHVFETLPLLCVGLFSIVVVTTATYQKLLMDIKIRKLGEYNTTLIGRYKKLLRKYFRYRRIKH